MVRPANPQDGGGGTAGDAATDAPPHDGSNAGASDGPAPDAPDAPVALGVIPVPRGGEAGPQPLDETEAMLQALAAGSRAVSLVRRWDDLYPDGVTPAAAAWSHLASDASLLRTTGRSVLLCLGLVDRELDARPAPLAGAWDGAEVLQGIDRMVDQVFASFGPELSYLAFGYQIDRRLDVAQPAERAGLVALAVHAMQRARSHPNRPAGTRVAVSASAGALLAPTPSLSQLLAAAEVASVTYLAVDASFRAREPSVAADDLDALSAAVLGESGAMSLVVQEVGYPSSPQAGSSPEQQQSFYQGLLQALGSRRTRFPFVSVRGLRDAWPASCEGDATAAGAAGDPDAVAAFCSLGLQQADGTPKPSWNVVLDGLATFREP